MRLGSGAHQLGVDLRERARIHSDLDDARANARAVNAFLKLASPSSRQLFRSFLARNRRHVFVVRSTIETGIGDDVQARGTGQPFEEIYVSTEKGRRAFHQRPATCGAQSLEMWQCCLEDFLGVVALRDLPCRRPRNRPEHAHA